MLQAHDEIGSAHYESITRGGYESRHTPAYRGLGFEWVGMVMTTRKAALRPPNRTTWSSAALLGGTTVVLWPTSLPGTDLEERPRRRVAPAPKRRIRRGRIQLIAA
jgi:hypothetical protein